MARSKPFQATLLVRVSVEFLRNGGNDPGYASLPACSRGQRLIDRNQTPPKSPCLCRIIIVCNPAHSAPSATSVSIGSSTHDCTLEAMRTQVARNTLANTRLANLPGRIKQ